MLSSAPACSIQTLNPLSLGFQGFRLKLLNPKTLNPKRCVLQDASSTLFLCVMLRKYPVETEAIVSAVGPKYLAAYLPEYGMEARVTLDKLGEGISATYSKNSNSVVISTGYVFLDASIPYSMSFRTAFLSL